jgi:hypothetical protein
MVGLKAARGRRSEVARELEGAELIFPLANYQKSIRDAGK